ncbi:hypothetical protein [Streptomyces sp. NBC_01264]|uniref:hypothetical protein n=1 Tax=Streptomyces sp. NBC_01264 TaxID=2903804 RepID=UPI0022579793|nr:hypothetical protein [Streptomyces sp. NBC_01264]MCX4784137.1 hypothetical protein [Streptomyces sp. NBC_01264]
MSTPRLPAFAKYRPLRSEDGERTRVTVRDAFGVDGWFFDVPGTADSSPRTFAVLHLPGTVTPSGWGWAVRGVEGDRRQYGRLGLTRHDAVRGALKAVEDCRNEPDAALRIEHRASGWALHVRCACPGTDDFTEEEFTDFASAADWLDGDPTAPWRFCTGSPTRLTWTDGCGHKRHGQIWGTARHHTGWAAIDTLDDLGVYPRVFLRDLSADAI